MPGIDFFWDPVCPFAWITSRWAVEVAGPRGLDVRWRPISLRMVNDGHYDDPDLAWKKEGHELGLALLRVAAAVDAGHGNEGVGRFYAGLGVAIHVDGDRETMVPAGPLAERVLAECGLPPELAIAADDPGHDPAIRADTELSLQRTGGNVGTPVITFDPPDGPSFFGPVISRVPKGAEAVELWQAVETLARHRWFAELKRSLREPPQTAS